MAKFLVRSLAIGALVVLPAMVFGGCGPALTTVATTEAMHQVTDAMGTTVLIPDHPRRIIPVGVSTEDIVVPLVGYDRVAAVSGLPTNVQAATHIPGRAKGNPESIMAQNPDLVIVPDWQDPDMIASLRQLHIPVYVYRTPVTIADMKQLELTLATIVGERARGEATVAVIDKRLAHLKAFVATIPANQRKSAVYYDTMGVSGGAHSTFDDLCQYAGLINGGAKLQLDNHETIGREGLILINPDCIFMPSDTYAMGFGGDESQNRLYGDKALQAVSAIRNHRVYSVDAKALMSYSPYMVNAAEQMAKEAYGYEPKQE